MTYLERGYTLQFDPILFQNYNYKPLCNAQITTVICLKMAISKGRKYKDIYLISVSLLVYYNWLFPQNYDVVTKVCTTGSTSEST